MNNINNLSGLDKAGLLFQMLGESLALTLFNNMSESDLLKIRIRSKELKNISVSVKKNANSPNSIYNWYGAYQGHTVDHCDEEVVAIHDENQ